MVVVILVLVLVAGIGWYTLFGQNAPLEDGLVVGPAVTVVDGFAAMYVVPTDSGVLLIDAGIDTEARALIGALRDQDRTLDDVRAVFLTHGHSDHIGALSLLDVPVYAMAAEAPLVAGEVASNSRVGQMAGPNDGGLHVTHPVRDGEVVTVDGVDVQLLAMPGHTAGSAAIVVGDTVFVGDAGTVHKDGNIVGAIGIFSEDVSESDRNLAALPARLPPGVDHVAFGHSGPSTVDALGRFSP